MLKKNTLRPITDANNYNGNDNPNVLKTAPNSDQHLQQNNGQDEEDLFKFSCKNEQNIENENYLKQNQALYGECKNPRFSFIVYYIIFEIFRVLFLIVIVNSLPLNPFTQITIFCSFQLIYLLCFIIFKPLTEWLPFILYCLLEILLMSAYLLLEALAYFDRKQDYNPTTFNNIGNLFIYINYAITIIGCLIILISMLPLFTTCYLLIKRIFIKKKQIHPENQPHSQKFWTLTTLNQSIKKTEKNLNGFQSPNFKSSKHLINGHDNVLLTSEQNDSKVMDTINKPYEIQQKMNQQLNLSSKEIPFNNIQKKS